MKLVKGVATAWILFCLATAAAEAGLLAALWKRGTLNRQTAQNLLMVAYDVPLADIQARLQAQAHPSREEMVSFQDVQDAKTMAHLNLDLRDMCADKGLLDLRELDARVELEKNRYSKMKEEFDHRWEALRKDDADNALQDLKRKIESVTPALAKDQLVRILDDKKLDSDAAMQHVVTIFKGLPTDRRKKIVTEFLSNESRQLHEILRQIRLGMPEANLISDARQRLEQFSVEE